jgi:K+-transporting ATPase ATPase C chain
MLSHLRPALTLIAAFTVLTGVVMPLGFVGLGQAVFPFQAGGSLVIHDGHVVGSALLGQNFTSATYFHGRASALMGTDPKDSSKQVATPYDASESGASNLAPSAKALTDRVAATKAQLAPATAGAAVPGDAVTSSGSGLDPDISPENAALQIDRVARARAMDPQALRQIVAAHTSAPYLGFIGAPHVNVLALNLALDARGATAVAQH